MQTGRIWISSQQDRQGIFCRGGPPWPPSVEIAFANPQTVDSLNPVPTEGGHGGPPLQYVPG